MEDGKHLPHSPDSQECGQIVIAVFHLFPVLELGASKNSVFNPLPALPAFSAGRISDRSPTPPWAATDRDCGTVGRVWIDTN